jgi:hypothetical protein
VIDQLAVRTLVVRVVVPFVLFHFFLGSVMTMAQADTVAELDLINLGCLE